MLRRSDRFYVHFSLDYFIGFLLIYCDFYLLNFSLFVGFSGVPETLANHLVPVESAYPPALCICLLGCFV